MRVEPIPEFIELLAEDDAIELVEYGLSKPRRSRLARHLARLALCSVFLIQG